MQCPYCLVNIHDRPTLTKIGAFLVLDFYILRQNCPECHQLILEFGQVNAGFMGGPHRAPIEAPPPSASDIEHRRFIYPREVTRRAIPEATPEDIAQLYREASGVLDLSERASAALSRRCLQQLLALQGAAKGDLVDQIQEVLERRDLPKPLADDLDSVRVVGNFAAHPIKSKQTGTILEVETGEAQWTLDVLGDLIAHYYKNEKERAERRDRLNERLREAGRPPMRKSKA